MESHDHSPSGRKISREMKLTVSIDVHSSLIFVCAESCIETNPLHHVSDMLHWAYIRRTYWLHHLLKIFRMLFNTNSPNPIFEPLSPCTMPCFSGCGAGRKLCHEPETSGTITYLTTTHVVGLPGPD